MVSLTCVCLLSTPRKHIGMIRIDWYRCESGMDIFAWRVNWNYAYSIFSNNCLDNYTWTLYRGEFKWQGSLKYFKSRKVKVVIIALCVLTAMVLRPSHVHYTKLLAYCHVVLLLAVALGSEILLAESNLQVRKNKQLS